MQQPDTTTFDEALLGLLTAFAEGEDVPLSVVLRIYGSNGEFKRRIDIAALSLLSPTSEAIH
ncbi:MAG: hypothetical protein ACREDO_05230 [Methyloceanibacter sp.]